MDPSTFELLDLLIWTTVGFAVCSAVIVSWYLVRRPALDLTVKLALLLGVFVFPLLAAGSGNVVGFEMTKHRHFCAGCHVMLPHTDDAENARSTSLASMHARNKAFGDENCYGCHADYGMYGTVVTKMDGLTHALYYYSKYRRVPVEETFGKIKLYRPYRNQACIKCHSMKLAGFVGLEDHRGVLEEIASGTASCVSAGCHGPAHPFSKVERGR